MASSRPHRDSTLQQQTTDLVYHRSTSHDPALAHPVQRLHIQLLVGLDRHKPHRGTAHRFGDRFGINEVVLVGLHERLHVLCRHQAHLMPLFAQSPAKEMGPSASFHPNQANLHVRSETKKLRTRKLLPHDHFSELAQTNKMKHCLAKIDTNAEQVHWMPPRLPYTRPRIKRRRTIPLVWRGCRGERTSKGRVGDDSART